MSSAYEEQERQEQRVFIATIAVVLEERDVPFDWTAEGLVARVAPRVEVEVKPYVFLGRSMGKDAVSVSCSETMGVAILSGLPASQVVAIVGSFDTD